MVLSLSADELVRQHPDIRRGYLYLFSDRKSNTGIASQEFGRNFDRSAPLLTPKQIAKDS